MDQSLIYIRQLDYVSKQIFAIVFLRMLTLSRKLAPTVYPEILAIIKFGDLHKIRLYFNIGGN